MLQSSITAWLNKPQSVIQTTICLSRQTQAHLENPSQPSAAASKPEQAAQPALPNYSPALKESQTSSLLSLHCLRSLPTNVSLSPITAATLPSFRRLNSLLLPIPYQPTFYNEILTDPVVSSISLVAVWHDTPCYPTSHTDGSTASDRATNPPASLSDGRVVAGIRCRLIQSSEEHARPILYISTLATLSPFRNLSLASHLLFAVINTAIQEYDICAVEAHVWERNTEALEWYVGQPSGCAGDEQGSYRSRGRGFRVLRKEVDYYRRLSPSGAVVIRRKIDIGDRLAAQASETGKG